MAIGYVSDFLVIGFEVVQIFKSFFLFEKNVTNIKETKSENKLHYDKQKPYIEYIQAFTSLIFLTVYVGKQVARQVTPR